ncbi:SDR family oxidoreductase [Microbacterium sp. W4I20]|uniref:SDR family oxidoreductase n=1 Tax=Microbacterium sp. W4I20 TaxID=3042262 RepID=UPI00277EBF54|nr:SDR family oxidoreductase [Microbacterium sp. W4I20]MDQ0729122.1 NAD(P)-dependent dehydrogenase (short-subunit alcohol dehydrogenase family) [Microbacterium sp. W4I20]
MPGETHPRRFRLQPLRRRRHRALATQVAVITGGSSGIGRETALRMGRAGATVVVLGRHEGRLLQTVADIVAQGGQARQIVCDVQDAAAVQAAADTVESWFGRIDTWVNNAGVLIYAGFEETTPAEFRRMMEIDFLGQVHGAQAALPALRRAGGGALISISSIEAVTTLPFHSAYAASKRAVEGAMMGLRRELRATRDPISVTIIRPAVIDTPGYNATRSRLGHRPSAPPPYYAASVVASCILYAAEHPVDELFAGGSGRFISALQRTAPRLLDRVFGRWGMRMMHTPEPAPSRPGNLAAPSSVADPDGLPRRGRTWSASTSLAIRPGLRRFLFVALTASSLAAVGRLTGTLPERTRDRR